MPVEFNKLAAININRKDRSKTSKIAFLLLQFIGYALAILYALTNRLTHQLIHIHSFMLVIDISIRLLSAHQFLPENLIFSRLTLREYNGITSFFDMFLTSRLVDYYFYSCFVILQTIVSLLFWAYYSIESNKILSRIGLGVSENINRDIEASIPASESVESSNDRAESMQILRIRRILNIVDCVSFTWRSIVAVPIWYSYFHAGLSSRICYAYLVLKLIEAVWNLYTLLTLVSVGVSGVLEYGRRSTIADLSQCQECSICYDNPKENVPLTLQCDHSFCEVCIMEWLVRDSTCPICRCKVISNFTNQRNIKKVAHDMIVIL